MKDGIEIQALDRWKWMIILGKEKLKLRKENEGENNKTKENTAGTLA